MLLFVLCFALVLLLVSLVYLFVAARYNRELQKSLDRLDRLISSKE